jgi:hypothetical protein
MDLPQVPNGPYCPGEIHTVASGYLWQNDFIGALCSSALQGSTTCLTGCPISFNSSQNSPVAIADYAPKGLPTRAE